MQKPSIGRTVHYVQSDGSHKPGIVHTVHSDSCVSLNVFDFGGVSTPSSVCLDAGTPGTVNGVPCIVVHRPGTWHWPETV